jgi:rhodanese-related sulfurtransferase
MENSNFTVVDVRSRDEFAGGNVAGSINIPLQEIVERAAELDAMIKPIIFCCLSGNRSGQAAAYFKAQGLECENGGSWFDVNSKYSK